MGANVSAFSPDADYSRLAKGGPSARPTVAYKKEKTLSARELAALLPYLESMTEYISGRVDAMSATQDGWGSEYNAIRDGNDSPRTASENPSHVDLNRYRNIVAYDHSRVKVTPNSHNNNTDFVNASYMKGHLQNKAYIASQGPVPASFNAFWQMVWEQGVEGIVMVTNEIEKNKLKCHRYWPSRESPTEQYGDITVTLEEEEPHSTYIMRSFKLVAGKASTTVVHFQYTVWPDHGVPNTTSEILGFRKAVRKAVPAYGPPLLVHCSAGVGRTGSFCVVDTMLSRGDAMDRDFSVEKLVKEFRSDRNYMVQTLIQYQFCFRAVLDGLHKSIARTVRAIKKKSASVIEDAALQLDELQGDIADALDVYVGSEKDEAAFLTLGRKAGRGIKPDVRWSEFDAESDKQVATAVPKAVREESLTMAQDLWRVRGNVPMAPDEHGYLEGQAAPLEKRVESLALHASPEAWKTRYAAVSSEWVAEVYDVGASLNPIESRLMSLASQNESWKLRGQHYRDSLVAEQRAIKVTYDARMNSLETVVVGSEDRWRDRGDGMRGKKAETNGIVEHTADTFGSYEQRISRLSTFASSSGGRGTTDGREVESPVKKKKAAAEIRARLDAERLEESQRLEQIRLTKMREERRAREAEAAHNAEKPIQGAGRHLLNKTPKQLVTLRETARPKAVHPMVAQASAKAGKGKKKK